MGTWSAMSEKKKRQLQGSSKSLRLLLGQFLDKRSHEKFATIVVYIAVYIIKLNSGINEIQDWILLACFLTISPPLQPQSKSHLMGSSITYLGHCFSTFDHHQEISMIPAKSHPEMLGHYWETLLTVLGYNLVLLNEYHIFQLCIFIKYYLYT